MCLLSVRRGCPHWMGRSSHQSEGPPTQTSVLILIMTLGLHHRCTRRPLEGDLCCGVTAPVLQFIVHRRHRGQRKALGEIVRPHRGNPSMAAESQSNMESFSVFNDTTQASIAPYHDSWAESSSTQSREVNRLATGQGTCSLVVFDPE